MSGHCASPDRRFRPAALADAHSLDARLKHAALLIEHGGLFGQRIVLLRRATANEDKCVFHATAGVDDQILIQDRLVAVEFAARGILARVDDAPLGGCAVARRPVRSALFRWPYRRPWPPCGTSRALASARGRSRLVRPRFLFASRGCRGRRSAAIRNHEQKPRRTRIGSSDDDLDESFSIGSSGFWRRLKRTAARCRSSSGGTDPRGFVSGRQTAGSCRIRTLLSGVGRRNRP